MKLEYEISGSTADDAERAVMASENVNTPENRQFLKQQENLSRQLRENLTIS